MGRALKCARGATQFRLAIEKPIGDCDRFGQSHFCRHHTFNDTLSLDNGGASGLSYVQHSARHWNALPAIDFALATQRSIPHQRPHRILNTCYPTLCALIDVYFSSSTSV